MGRRCATTRVRGRSLTTTRVRAGGTRCGVVDSDATAEEGETVELAVTLSKASADVVTVMYWTVGGTALAGSDYTAATGTLTFLAGSRREVIEVETIEDELAESDEGFTVELRAPSGATLRDDTGTGTIIDDDTDTARGTRCRSCR